MKLFLHQQKIIDANPQRAGLFLSTGGGKSLTASLLAQGKTLVICPKTQTLDGTWTKAWSMAKKDLILLTIISKEQFKKQADILPTYDTVIIDEAHTCAGVSPSTYQRNYVKYPKTSQIYTAVHSYLAKNSPKRLYLLTATPNSTPMTLYGLASFLGYKWDYKKYRDFFYWEWKRNIWRVKNTNICKKKMAVLVNKLGYVGRLQDWFDVPEQTNFSHYVGTTPEQRKAFKELRLLYPNPRVQLGKRHMLEQGIFEDTFLKENKIKVIKQYTKEFKQLIIFCRYTKQIERYATVLHNVYTLTGKTKDRGTLLSSLRKKDNYILIVQSSISTGWELPECSCMIFASEFYPYTDRIQAMGRILRANHLKKNLYVTLLAGEADKKVRAVLETGKDFSEEIFAESLSKSKTL